MKRAVMPLLFVGCLMATPSWAACSLPAPPAQFPDGAEVERADMARLRQQLERYLDEQGRFFKCLDAMEKTARGTGYDSEERRVDRIARYNAAMAEMYEAINRFNDEVQRFNQR
ncbi:hypothetical protein [Spongiibacter sp.]|uniref:hypothetical protein n=1 Tax=Spongiibacter sp. TaxID=2024860 RepID=UPI003569604F